MVKECLNCVCTKKEKEVNSKLGISKIDDCKKLEYIIDENKITDENVKEDIILLINDVMESITHNSMSYPHYSNNYKIKIIGNEEFKNYFTKLIKVDFTEIYSEKDWLQLIPQIDTYFPIINETIFAEVIEKQNYWNDKMDKMRKEFYKDNPLARDLRPFIYFIHNFNKSN